MTDEQRRYAMIMAECGCEIADIMVTLDLTEGQAWWAVIPVIRSNGVLYLEAATFLARVRSARLELAATA